MKKTIMKKNAFTMLELVFAIVVIGILAALAIPRLDRDLRQGAKDNLLSAIRHTQGLALVDNKTNPSDPSWQTNLWKISFQADGSYYTVSSGSDFAIDPVSGKLMDGGSNASKNIFLGKKYSVNSITGCTEVGFDNLGRPFDVNASVTPYAGYMTSDCIITISFEQSGITPLNITIETETGHISGD